MFSNKAAVFAHLQIDYDINFQNNFCYQSIQKMQTKSARAYNMVVSELSKTTTAIINDLMLIVCAIIAIIF